MSWASDMPAELSTKPMPLIVLTGLDIKHNAIHKEIWDGFTMRNNQKFRYKLLDGDHEYPKVKNKRPTEFYIPKGIFKTNWLNKHLYLVPGLVVIFFDLDWDEPNWKEKQMECATKVELVRHSLLDRNTRIILILIQKHPSIPMDGDNALVRDRYPALCSACSIKTNYLFLLHAEHLHGYIAKLEDDAFTEPTQTYYSLEIKAVKFKRDSLIKVTHQFLFVRLAIKIAFFHEMKADTFKALEYYKQAYLSLLDIRFYDTNILEIKTVAGMINFKLCQLFFEIRHPIDAIDQFRKHIDIFRIKVGPPELVFEHSAWLSKQFQLMGELFEDAINKGNLTAVQTQHPGFYFHSAANHSIQRRLNCKDFSLKSMNKIWTPENPSPVESINNLEFYGQRPWRQGQQGMEIIDQQKERDGILCLQELELKVNLTPLITELFKQAVTHFKRFNCERMKQYLMVCMAEEYLFAKEYQKALNIYVKVLNDYSNEHWWPILTSIMSNAIKCAYLVADITNYCLLCIELIGKNIQLTNNEKSLLQKNLLRVLANEIPQAEYHQIESSSETLASWEDVFAKSRKIEASSAVEDSNASQSDKNLIMAAHKIIPAHVSSMVPFVECKVSFASPVFNSNQYVELFLFIRTNCVDPIQFNKLYIRFNLPNYNQHCIIENVESLLFTPDVTKDYKFKFLAQAQDIGKDLEINSISLELGNRDVRVLVLHWKGDCKNALATENNTVASFSILQTKASASKVYTDPSNPNSSIDWDSIPVNPTARIISKKAKIELKLGHKMPIFVDEYYAIKLTIDNQEDKVIEDLSLSAELVPANETSSSAEPVSYRLWIGELNKSLSQTTQTTSIKSIEARQQYSETIYVQLKDISSVNLNIKVKYNVDVRIKMINYEGDYVYKQFANLGSLVDPNNEFVFAKEQIIKCTCIQEDALKLESINAFKFDFKFLSMQMKPVKSVRYGEPFLLLIEIKNETPYSLKLRNSALEALPNIVCKIASNFENHEKIESFLKGEALKRNEMATECFCLTVDDSTNQMNSKKTTSLGEYYVEWKRKDSRVENQGEIDLDDDQDDNEANDESMNEPENSPKFLFVKTKVKLPEIVIESFPFLIEAKLPTFGHLEQHLTVTYTIKNKTQAQILDLECNLEENEHFSIGGSKLGMFQVLPNDSTDYSYVAFPLQAGYCRLPVFHLKVNNVKLTNVDETQANGADASFTEWNQLDHIIQNMIPNNIFIMPEKADPAQA